jgi:hypothetical protein
MTTFFSYKALESQRASGYKNTTHAIAELVDNAFDAGAEVCNIIFLEKRNSDNRKYIDEILIADNGVGMDQTVLSNCLQFGGGTNDDIVEIIGKNKIGKFGYGLPNASLSQCPNIQVFSWQSATEILTTKLNLEELKQTASIEIPPITKTAFPSYFENVSAFLSKDNGTVVSWKDCDRLSNSRAATIMEKSEVLLGKLFRYLITEGKIINMLQYELSDNNSYVLTQQSKVRPNDPLFLMSDCVISKVLFKESKNKTGAEAHRDPSNYYKMFSKSEKKSEPTNVKLDDQSYTYRFNWKGKTFKFDILSSFASIHIQKPGIRDGGSTLIGRFYKDKEKDNISFIRANREISSGNFGFYNQSDPRQRWWSIEVKFTPDADELLGVHNNKQGIEFEYTDSDDPSIIYDQYKASLQEAREELWCGLTKVLEVARKAVWKEVMSAAKEWDSQHADGKPTDKPSLPGGSPTTVTTMGKVDGKRTSQFPDEDKKELLERLTEKYPAVSKEEINSTIEKYDKSLLRACVLYSASESEKLWTFTNVGEFLIVLINTNHNFYSNILLFLKTSNNEKALSAMELFITSLAYEEHINFNGNETIENFRTYAGIHLNKYVKDLDINFDDIEDQE